MGKLSVKRPLIMLPVLPRCAGTPSPRLPGLVAAGARVPLGPAAAAAPPTVHARGGVSTRAWSAPAEGGAQTGLRAISIKPPKVLVY